MNQPPKFNKGDVWRRLRRLVSGCRYRWKTRKEWWVVTYRTEGWGVESGHFASMGETREDAIADAREHLEEHASISGDCRFTVRRPNLLHLFFR